MIRMDSVKIFSIYVYQIIHVEFYPENYYKR